MGMEKGDGERGEGGGGRDGEGGWGTGMGKEKGSGEGGQGVRKAFPGAWSRLIFPSFLPDWNTWSDEDALPQLRRVSCASLACLLKHTGLFLYATNCW